MIKSTFLTYRSMTALQLQAWFSLRPHTREQKYIKSIIKQEERLIRARLRLHSTPIVVQNPSLDTTSISVHRPHFFTSRGTDEAESQHPSKAGPPSIYNDTLNPPYNQSEGDSAERLNVRCAGCGAQLHCNNPESHGFLPASEIERIKTGGKDIFRRRKRSSNSAPTKLCTRCQLTGQHESALKQFLIPVDNGDQVFNELNNQSNSTILLMADILNLPHSLLPLRLTNPSMHKIVLIGNKVDQLPIDGPNFYSRWCKALIDAFTKTTGLNEDHLSYIALVSAVNGYGIQRLLDFLLSKRFSAFDGPVYLVGSTNTGKSSLFNRLLLSDFCKSEAKESIRRATVSFWPGTTAGLLKFPLTRMSFVKRALRAQSKYTHDHTTRASSSHSTQALYGYMAVRDEDQCASTGTSDIDSRVERARGSLQDLSSMPTYRLRQQNSDSKASDSVMDDSSMDLNQVLQKELGFETVIERHPTSDREDRLLVCGTLDPRRYNTSAWCHDTPGLNSPDQTLNFLSPGQLVEYVKLTEGKKSVFHLPEKRFILPRTFVLQVGLTMLLGQLGRVDVLASNGPVYLTTHTRLPVHIVETDAVDWYSEQYAFFLGPGTFAHKDSPVAPTSLPEMASVEIEPITPGDLDASVADVVLSGAGWVSVAGIEAVNGAIRLRAWTPGGVGVDLRQPALLPYAVRRRGTRLLYLREFSGTEKTDSYEDHAPPS